MITVREDSLGEASLENLRTPTTNPPQLAVHRECLRSHDDQGQGLLPASPLVELCELFSASFLKQWRVTSLSEEEPETLPLPVSSRTLLLSPVHCNLSAHNERYLNYCVRRNLGVPTSHSRGVLTDTLQDTWLSLPKVRDPTRAPAATTDDRA